MIAPGRTFSSSKNLRQRNLKYKILWKLNPARKKQMSSRVVFPEKRFKATHDVEALGSDSMSTLLGYIQPRKDDAPPIVIRKNSKYPLVNPAIPKGVHVSGNIVPNLKKLLLFD